MNLEKYNAVLTHIEQHPEEWDQQHWCGTACCFAGHGKRMFDESGFWSPWNATMKHLDLSSQMAGWLFDANRTVDDFRRVRLVAGWANFPKPTL